MELTLIRTTFTDMSTIGTLHSTSKPGNGPVCFILEDKDRNLERNPAGKVPGKTAIPRGRYPVVITMSNRFKKELPLVQNVPGFEGIRIHPGNYPQDTEGCLLPGVTCGANMVFQSRDAFAELDTMIRRAIARNEQVWLTVK